MKGSQVSGLAHQKNLYVLAICRGLGAHGVKAKVLEGRATMWWDAMVQGSGLRVVSIIVMITSSIIMVIVF